VSELYSRGSAHEALSYRCNFLW